MSIETEATDTNTTSCQAPSCSFTLARSASWRSDRTGTVQLVLTAMGLLATIAVTMLNTRRARGVLNEKPVCSQIRTREVRSTEDWANQSRAEKGSKKRHF